MIAWVIERDINSVPNRLIGFHAASGQASLGVGTVAYALDGLFSGVGDAAFMFADRKTAEKVLSLYCKGIGRVVSIEVYE